MTQLLCEGGGPLSVMIRVYATLKQSYKYNWTSNTNILFFNSVLSSYDIAT